MPRLHQIIAAVFLGLLALVAPPASLADDAENLRRLQDMPRERRVALSENLARFDKLSSTDQAAIRKLDAEIARMNPVEQARYRSNLHRYHLWVNGLTEDQKAKLKAADSAEARMNLVLKFRLEQQQAGPTGPRLFGIRIGDYGLIGPFEAAHLLRIWNRLTPAQKSELERQKERGRLFDEIRAHNKSIGVPFQPFPIDEERPLDARLDSDKAFKAKLDRYAKRVDAFPKKADAVKGEALQKRFELRYAEFLYFEERKPKAVKQSNLERFSSACPDWIHEMIDSLSPDDARAYLTILYRLLYPEPTEMPPSTKAPKSAGTPSPAPSKAATKKSGQADAF